MEFLVRLQKIDRRVIYALVFVLVTAPIFVGYLPPLTVGPEAQKFYDNVDKLSKDKVVFITADFGAGTSGENRPQCRAVMEHLMRRGLKFILLSFDPQGADYANDLVLDLARQYPAYGSSKYGETWVNFGFKYTTEDTLPGTLQTLGTGFRSLLKGDRKGQNLDDIPMMKGLNDWTQVSALCEFTGSDSYEYLVRYLCGPKKMMMLTGCTGIISPAIYPYLDTGQMQGLLNGMRGAAEYEKLLGYWDARKLKQGGKGMNSQSVGALLIIFLIVLGNLSMLAEKKLATRESAG